jgi:ABC-type branched-subunit amino acid transport system ATPase component
VLQTGRMVLHGAASDVMGNPLVQTAFLGIGAA